MEFQGEASRKIYRVGSLKQKHVATAIATCKTNFNICSTENELCIKQAALKECCQ